jgi:uncharacterized protein (TIGR03067 family)
MVRMIVVTLMIAGAGAVARAGEEKKTDAEAIRGDWKVVSAKETNGFKDNIDVAEYKDSVWTFTEQELTIRKDRAETKLAYRLNPAAKPKQIDLIRVPAGRTEKLKLEGIFELDGDKLTICYTVSNLRPSDFSMGRGIAAIKRLVVLERQKK